jgi:hypothetical protein
VSRKRAMIGYERFANWFQRLTTVTARPISHPANPQRLRIPYAPAIPTAAPAGTTIDSAVDACVSISARRKLRLGSATIHGGAKVSKLRIAAAARATIDSHERSRTTPQTSR